MGGDLGTLTGLGGAIIIGLNRGIDAARAEWRRIQRGLAELELTMAHGRADVLSEAPLRVSGFKPEINATPWLVTEV